MAVVAADLTKRVRFEANAPVNLSPTTGPGKIDDYDLFLTTWGHYKESSGNRALDFGEIVENSTGKLTVRYQIALYNKLFNESVESLRVIFDNRKFTIAKWKLVDEKKEWIELTLNEKR